MFTKSNTQVEGLQDKVNIEKRYAAQLETKDSKKADLNENIRKDLEAKSLVKGDGVKIEQVDFSGKMIDKSLSPDFTYKEKLGPLASKKHSRENDVKIMGKQLTFLIGVIDNAVSYLMTEAEQFMTQYKTGEVHLLPLRKLYLYLRKAEREEHVKTYQSNFVTLREVFDRHDYSQAKIILENLLDYAKSISARENSLLHGTPLPLLPTS